MSYVIGAQVRFGGRQRGGVGEDLHAPVLDVERLADDRTVICVPWSVSTTRVADPRVRWRSGTVVATTISPGPVNQEPDDHPVAARGVVAGERRPRRARPVIPATVISVLATPLYPPVPGWAVIALTTAAGSVPAAAGAGPVTRWCGPPGGGPAAPAARTSSDVAVRSVAWTWFSDGRARRRRSTAAAPNAIAATIVADRTGRANGWARPRRHRPGQRQPAGQPGRPLAAAGAGRTADGERVDGAQPAGPGAGRPGGHGHQRPAPRRRTAASTQGATPGVGRAVDRVGLRPGPGRSGGCRRRRRARRRPRPGSAPGPT